MTRKPRIVPRKMPKQPRSQATVELLLSTAADLLVRDGYARLNTNRIAERAGVSIGSLYQYFPSKEALIAGLANRHVDQMIALMRRAWAGRPLTAPIPETTREVVSLLVQAHAADAALLQVLVEYVPRFWTHARQLDERLYQRAYLWLYAHRKNIQRDNLKVAAFVVVQAVESIVHAAVVHGPEELLGSELVDEVTAFVVGYLQWRPARPGGASHS